MTNGNVKVAVIYYSSTGHNYQLAKAAAEAAEQAGAQVRLRKVRETAPQTVIDTQEVWKSHQVATADVPEATLDDLDWADALVFSTPTRYGGAASQMRAFIDITGPLWAQGKLANKTATVMTSAQNPHGGVETTLQGMYISLMHWGCILVPPGYTDQSVFAAGGNPYGTSAVASGNVSEEALNAARYQTRRLVDVTSKYKGG